MTDIEYQEQIISDLKLDVVDKQLGLDGSNAFLVSGWWDEFAWVDLQDPQILVSGPSLRALYVRERALHKMIQDGRKTGVDFNDSGSGIQQGQSKRIATLENELKAVTAEKEMRIKSARATRPAVVSPPIAGKSPNPWGPNPGDSYYRGDPLKPVAFRRY